ncbi:hypothetical protein GCM10022381_17510 [Leifsonia kafniensis]|uniref:Leucine-rich repeat domain-containing protein n=1 Tax=Leifsonia kafniensis TaxID=475957 RepID=A0ABP7KEX1_9MICO
MNTSTLDHTRPTARTRQRLARAGALLMAGLLASGALLATAAPAQATPNSITTIDGITYTYDPVAAESGATASAYDGATQGTTVTIPRVVAFAPDGPTLPVTAIGDFAFASQDEDGEPLPGFEKLTAVEIPDTITAIGDSAFLSNRLETLSLPDSVATIGEMAFLDNKLTSVDLPSGLTEINTAAFGMNSLTGIDIPDTVTRIGESAFLYNELQALDIPDSVISIETQAFLNNALTSLTLGNSVESIGLGAFMWNSLESIVIPASVHTMFGVAFGENNTYFLTRPLAPDFDPDILKDEDSTLTSVTFLGRPPTTFVPTTGPSTLPNPDNDYELMGSLGSGTSLTVNYPYAFETADPSTGFTSGTWQGYASAAYAAVSFEMGGHGDQAAPQRITVGQTATAPATAPEGSGYTFTGWFTDAAATMAFNFSSVISGDTIIYAGWTKNPAPTANVIFSMNGHGAQVDSQAIAIGSLATAPKTPSASGYTFTGWFTDAAATQKFDFITPISGTTSLYAGWTKNPVVTTTTVSFAMNGHGKQIASQTVTLGKLVTKPTSPSASGYAFTGWFTDTKATKKFSFTTKITAKTTLYAGWKKTAAVTFNMKGHGKQVAARTVILGKLVTKPTSPSASGYAFTGWFTDTKTTKKFNFSTKITGKTTLYAGWTKTATVTFNMKGHGKQVAATTVIVGKLLTKPTSPTASGYAFTGWFTDTKTTKKFSFTTKITAKTTLYAGWKKKPSAR